MQEKIIAKSEIESLLDGLKETHSVIAPVRKDDGVSFDRISSGDEVVLEFSNTRKVPKSIFFPQQEVMFAYSKSESGVQIKEPALEENLVLFGVRPCDAQSFLLLDAVFGSEDYEDVYYTRRRDGVGIIGLACNNPRKACFCTTVGGGPFNHNGMDVLLVDLGDRYLAEAVTEYGEELISSFPAATDSDKQKKADMHENAEKAMKPVVADLEALRDKLDTAFTEDFWDDIHMKCIGCATCTYLCPTCHCFDIYEEEETDTSGYRLRMWDSCSLSLFTLHTSGHNPRPSAKERMRQRIMHKFNYFAHNYGEYACVGCGRCVQNCPVNLDIRAVLDMVARS
ncbi:4Fe-4S dicluster domain-containing protein [Candidatus Poribacteria bacterium]